MDLILSGPSTCVTEAWLWDASLFRRRREEKKLSFRRGGSVAMSSENAPSAEPSWPTRESLRSTAGRSFPDPCWGWPGWDRPGWDPPCCISLEDSAGPWPKSPLKLEAPSEVSLGLWGPSGSLPVGLNGMEPNRCMSNN